MLCKFLSCIELVKYLDGTNAAQYNTAYNGLVRPFSFYCDS
jgi:hypothetical protein